MKKIITTFFSLTLALAPATMQAQEHIEAAFKKFIKEVKVSKFETKAKQAGKKKFDNYLTIYNFTLKGKDVSRIEAINEAFNADESNAYNIISRTGDDHNGMASLTLMGKMTVIAGEKYENFNVMCFEDPNDSTMRYAYAVEWEVDKGDAIVDGRPTDSSVKGRLIETYSPRPKGVSETKYEKFTRITQPSLYFDKKRKGTIIQDIDKLVTDDEALKRLGKQDWKIDKYIKKFDRNTQDGNTYYNVGDQYLMAKELESASWLSIFNNMSNLTEKYPKGKTTSYYVATIYDLCKNASQLDSDEQKLVVKELDRLITLVPDTFLKELLKKSKKCLKE